MFAEGLVHEVCYRSGGNDTKSKGFLFSSGFVGLLQRFGVLTTVLLQIQLRWFKIVPACSTLLWAGTLRHESILTVAFHSPCFRRVLCRGRWCGTALTVPLGLEHVWQCCLSGAVGSCEQRGWAHSSLWVRPLWLCLPRECFFKQCDYCKTPKYQEKNKRTVVVVRLQLLGTQYVCICRSTYLHPHAVCLAGNTTSDVIFFHQASS